MVSHLRFPAPMNRTAVLNIVGLTKGLIGEHTPHISRFCEQNQVSHFKPAFPAVTCTAQSTYLTGTPPDQHHIVGNGWYDREAAEVKFWKQSNHLVHGPKIWDTLRAKESDFSCAVMFWWYNMYSSADFSATPRPLYGADGSKHFDIHTHPMGLREELKNDLKEFPFPAFWGPRAGIKSSQWIADSARWIEKKKQPTLNLIYLPHLDYCLQKDGPNADSIPAELRKIDKVVGGLIEFFEKRNVQVRILSEYGISPVDQAVDLNRSFRRHGWIQVKDELGRETLDCGTCKVFAVADHQVAHIYIKDPAMKEEVREFLLATQGVAEVREPVDDDRSGDLVAVAEPNAWFTYYFWTDDRVAPDYARTIDIHRKPGYDPCELFIDPDIKSPRLKIAKLLLRKKLGFRTLMDVIPLDASLVKGSHGRDDVPESEQPVYIGPETPGSAVEVHDALISALTEVREPPAAV